MVKFTIITASYNYEEYIKETIESVLNQTYQNWEMLVVDDGSKDNSVEVIKSYCQKDQRIKLLTHKNNENRGLIETIKLGVKNTNTDWIVFLESDDTITNDYLEKKANVIEKNPEVKFIFNDVNLFGSEERIKEYDEYFVKQKKALQKYSYPKLQTPAFKEINPVPTFSCTALKKELLEGISYNSPIKAFLDYYLWMQLAAKTSFYFIDEKLTNWRMHDSYIKHTSRRPLDDMMFKYCKKKYTIKPPFKALLPFLYVYYLLHGLRKNILRIHFKQRVIYINSKEYKF